MIRYLNHQIERLNSQVSDAINEVHANQLTIQCFPADGDCFYRAFSAALRESHLHGGTRRDLDIQIAYGSISA